MAGDDSDGSSSVVGLALRGARAYFTGSTARDALGAVDVGALLDGERVEDAIEREQAGRTIGRVLGRKLADELAEGNRVQAFAVRIAGQRVGARLGEAVVVALLEYDLLAMVIDELRGRTTDDALLGLLNEVEAVVTGDETGTPDDTDSVYDVEGGTETTDHDADDRFSGTDPASDDSEVDDSGTDDSGFGDRR